MTLTGHKILSIFECYNIVSEGNLDMAARKLDEISQKIKRDSADTLIGG